MRADLYLVRSGHTESRTLAQKLIADGAVTLDGRVVAKASEDVSDAPHTVTVSATADTRYVGRGGLKLEAALAAFPVDPAGAVVADIGASTGGFTDCLLQRGAKRVYAVDAGHGQLHPKLLADPRVRSAEGQNARYLTPAVLAGIEAGADAPDPAFAGVVDGCVTDVSFISQTLIHGAIAGILCDGGWFISLIKPQFELDGRALGKHGIVKSERDRRAAADRVIVSAAACGLHLVALIPSPIEGGDGNREFLAYFRKQR